MTNLQLRISIALWKTKHWIGCLFGRHCWYYGYHGEIRWCMDCSRVQKLDAGAWRTTQ